MFVLTHFGQYHLQVFGIQSHSRWGWPHRCSHISPESFIIILYRPFRIGISYRSIDQRIMYSGVVNQAIQWSQHCAICAFQKERLDGAKQIHWHNLLLTKWKIEYCFEFTRCWIDANESSRLVVIVWLPGPDMSIVEVQVIREKFVYFRIQWVLESLKSNLKGNYWLNGALTIPPSGRNFPSYSTSLTI